MMKRTWILFVLAGLLIAGVSLKACAKEPAPPADAPQAAAPAPAPQSATPVPAEEQIQEAETIQETAGDDSPADRGDAGLERLAALPADQQLPNGRWTAGTHYVPLVPSQPTGVGPGEVEVVEVFWYGCPHCYALDPYLDNWDKTNADYIKLVKVPVIWSPGHRAQARLFYALEALGRGDLHKKVFQAIHEGRNPMLASSEQATTRLHVDFAKANGIDEKAFTNAYNSFTVNTNLQRAERLTQAYRVASVPVIVVNGKYVTDVEKARGNEQLTQLLTDLAASERR